MGCDKRVARPYHPGTLGVPFADVISALKCTKHSPFTFATEELGKYCNDKQLRESRFALKAWITGSPRRHALLCL